MGTVVLLAIALLMPTGAAYGVVAARRLRALHERRRPPLPTAVPVERIHGDLRRLHDQLGRAENAPSDLPAKYRRCQAVRAAYLDVLTDACRQFDVPLPAGSPVSRAEIYRVESDLRLAGLDVRVPG